MRHYLSGLGGCLEVRSDGSDVRHYLSGLGGCLEVIRKNPADSWRGSRSCLRKSRAYLTRYVPSLDIPALSGSHAKIRTKLRRSSEQIIFCRSMTFIWSHFYSRFFFMRNERRGGEQSGEERERDRWTALSCAQRCFLYSCFPLLRVIYFIYVFSKSDS